MAMVALLFLSCVNTEDPTQGATVRLKLTGGIAVNQPADDATRAAVSESEKLTVNSMRVLIFNNGALVSNNLFTSGYTIDGSGDNWIVSMNDNAAYVEARYGTNDVYVVLNEAAGGLTASLEAVQNQTAMDNLRQGKVEYTNLITVNDNEPEPAFIMCVHDVVTIDATKTTLDLTGLAESSYGFPMRRTMAKVVLESVVGGVDLNNTIVGTSTAWDGNASKDQIPDDTDNTALIATSAVHILGLDLVNVPTHYSWQQDEYPATNNYPASPTTYRDPIKLATSQFNADYNYFDREWNGDINVTGKVPFTRVDALADFWKTENNAASYAVVFENQVPDSYFIWSNSQNITRSNILGWDLTYANPDKSASSGYDHYTIDSKGIVHAYNSQNEEIFLKGAPNDHFNLNSGNFITFYTKSYWENQNYKPGIPVAGTPTMGAVVIDPAVWELQFDNAAYYIPENITANTTNQTKLRIKLSIATPSAAFTQQEIQELIDNFLEKNQGYVGDLVQDEGSIALTKENIDKFLWVKGNFVPNAKDPNAYAIQYGGLKREFKGETDVTNKAGSYQAIIGTNVTPYIIEVPLNNKDATDHNIYRGHEYRVKLYVTKKSSANWTPVAEANRSVTYHELPAMTTRGGESDLCIAAEVIATPVE